MNANIIVEQTNDGFFSCFVEEEIPYVGLLGYGESASEAVNNLMEFYKSMKEQLALEGKQIPELEFSVHYDMPSFFNRFSFLNVSKIAQIAGINPSLMRKYTSGVANAGPKQYEKLKVAIRQVASDLMEATA